MSRNVVVNVLVDHIEPFDEAISYSDLYVNILDLEPRCITNIQKLTYKRYNIKKSILMPFSIPLNDQNKEIYLVISLKKQRFDFSGQISIKDGVDMALKGNPTTASQCVKLRRNRGSICCQVSIKYRVDTNEKTNNTKAHVPKIKQMISYSSIFENEMRDRKKGLCIPPKSFLKMSNDDSIHDLFVDSGEEAVSSFGSPVKSLSSVKTNEIGRYQSHIDRKSTSTSAHDPILVSSPISIVRNTHNDSFSSPDSFGSSERNELLNQSVRQGLTWKKGQRPDSLSNKEESKSKKQNKTINTSRVQSKISTKPEKLSSKDSDSFEDTSGPNSSRLSKHSKNNKLHESLFGESSESNHKRDDNTKTAQYNKSKELLSNKIPDTTNSLDRKTSSDIFFSEEKSIEHKKSRKSELVSNSSKEKLVADESKSNSHETKHISSSKKSESQTDKSKKLREEATNEFLELFDSSSKSSSKSKLSNADRDSTKKTHGENKSKTYENKNDENVTDLESFFGDLSNDKSESKTKNEVKEFNDKNDGTNNENEGNNNVGNVINSTKDEKVTDFESFFNDSLNDNSETKLSSQKKESLNNLLRNSINKNGKKDSNDNIEDGTNIIKDEKVTDFESFFNESSKSKSDNKSKSDKKEPAREILHNDNNNAGDTINHTKDEKVTDFESFFNESSKHKSDNVTNTEKNDETLDMTRESNNKTEDTDNHTDDKKATDFESLKDKSNNEFNESNRNIPSENSHNEDKNSNSKSKLSINTGNIDVPNVDVNNKEMVEVDGSSNNIVHDVKKDNTTTKKNNNEDSVNSFVAEASLGGKSSLEKKEKSNDSLRNSLSSNISSSHAIKPESNIHISKKENVNNNKDTDLESFFESSSKRETNNKTNQLTKSGASVSISDKQDVNSKNEANHHDSNVSNNNVKNNLTNDKTENNNVENNDKEIQQKQKQEEKKDDVVNFIQEEIVFVDDSEPSKSVHSEKVQKEESILEETLVKPSSSLVETDKKNDAISSDSDDDNYF